jgi:exo-1,4-beta-D-glucosaminidase
MKTEFEADGTVLDRKDITFGIRKITSEFTEKGHRLFKINGHPILIKAAGWAADLILDNSPEKDEAEIRYVRDLNLNAIRFEGHFGSDKMLELCDRYGIMVLAGWCCCSEWEDWDNWDAENYKVSAASLDDQMKRLANHPSLIAWFNGSDFHPIPEVEKMYLDIIGKNRWPNPVIAAATEVPSEVSGPTGVKMTGPYEWVPPVYWYSDTLRGGAFGFNTETSPGPAIPVLESLKEMLPEDHLWPVDLFWIYHCGRGQFWNLNVVSKAMNKRYGESGSVEEYSIKAQASSYEAQRAMFEAFRRNKYLSTGVVQWMLSNPWPSMIWHLYDYYLRPGGGYFGVKKACEPLHIQYSYDDSSVVVVNDFYRPFPKMKAGAEVYDVSGKLIGSMITMIDVAPDSSTTVFTLLKQDVPLAFVRLTLKDSTGSAASSSTYWLSSKEDMPDWENFTWWYTPTKSFADLKDLNSLPQVELEADASSNKSRDETIISSVISNPSNGIAFMARLKLCSGKNGRDIVPVLWEDNYITLFPGETVTISASLKSKLSEPEPLVLAISGWNIQESLITVREKP